MSTKRLGLIKRELGIPLCIAFAAVFAAAASYLAPNFNGAEWYMLSSIQRAVFFIVEAYIFIGLFKKSGGELFALKGFGSGMLAGSAIFVFLGFYVVAYIVIGAKAWQNASAELIVWRLFFQQLTTGLWEELTFRVFVCEGYYRGDKRTAARRLTYALISALLFAALHLVGCDSVAEAVLRFINAAAWGLALAAVYLYSHSFLAAAFLHFFSDIFLNITGFVSEWNDSTLFTVLDSCGYIALLGIMLVGSAIFLIKRPCGELEQKAGV